MWVGGVEEYMSASWYVTMLSHTCQTPGNGDVTLLTVSVDWWCSGPANSVCVCLE